MHITDGKRYLVGNAAFFCLNSARVIVNFQRLVLSVVCILECLYTGLKIFGLDLG